MRTISTLPNNDRHNGWSALLPERKPNPVLQHAHDADYLIVGAGFAGLAAARRLAELRPNDTIVLLEAEQVGEGAQGRNSGFVIGAPHQARGGRLEIEQARKHLQLSQRAIEYLQTQVETHGIDCRSEEHTSELQSRGHLVCRLLLEKKHTAELQTRDN